MSEIGGSGSEVGGGSEVSSSEVSEAPAAETGGDASEATQEAANEQANESGGFEDDETETTMEDDESDEDVSDMDEESDESQDVGFEDSEGVDNTDDNPEDSDIDNNEETEMSDEDKVGFDDEDLDAEESAEEENSTDDIDPLNEDSDETEEEPEDTDAELEDNEADEDGDSEGDHLDAQYEEDEAEDDEYIEDEYDEEEDPGDIEQYTEDSDEREEDTSETDEEDNDEDEDDERELEEINEEAAGQVEQEAIDNNAEDNIKNETEIAEDENKKVAEDVPDADEATVDSNDFSLDDQVVEDTSDVESTEQDSDNSDLEEDFDENEEDYLDEGELEEYGEDEQRTEQNDTESEKADVENDASKAEQNAEDDDSSESKGAYEKAMSNMTEYMSEHNYGPDDYAEYSQDPERQKLNAEIEKIKNEGFLTNDGERVTYQEAVDRVTGKAEEYMKDMGVSDDKISEVKADMEQELYKQEIEARSRGIGDHGIRHIYGNAERGEQYLSSRDDVSSEQKLGVLVAQTYHDEGYSLKNDKVDNSGVLHGGADKKHDEASLDVWNSKKEMYSDVLSKETMASVDKAIGEHNIGSSDKLAVNEGSGIAEKTGKYDKNNEEDRKVIEAGEEDGRTKIKENTSSDADVVVSTVHISDKLALSEREKFSDALLKEPKLVELTEGTNSTLKSMSNEKLGFYDSNGKMTEQGKELLDKYHNQINDYIDSKYSEPDASRMKTAVEKDIGFNSGKFSSQMNYIYTPSDCYKYNPETKTNEITVYKVDHGDTKSQDLQNKQLEKLYEDLGLNDDEIASAIEQGGYEDKDRRLSVHVETKTADEIKELEAEKYQENNDLKETNERIDAGREQYQELNNKFLEVAETLEAEDINYDDYDKMCRACNKSDGCSKSEFEGKTDTDRKKLVNETMSEMVLTQVSNTLGKEELK